MIRSIRHKGLRRLYEPDNARGIFAEHVQTLRDILARIDAASYVSDMDIPGLRLHMLKSDYRGFGLSLCAQDRFSLR